MARARFQAVGGPKPGVRQGWHPPRPVARGNGRGHTGAAQQPIAEVQVRKVRLSMRQRQALSSALGESALPKGTKVYLYGSRTDPEAAGGDVDILVYAPRADRYELARRIRRAYQRKLDERIDVIVIDPERQDPAQTAFLRTVRKVPIR